MSKLYKKVVILVSRAYYHGSEGLERGGLVFFRNKEEYDYRAMRGGWKGNSYKQSWCVKPVAVEALVYPKHYVKFLQGETLSESQVFFSGDAVDKVSRIGS